MNYEGELGAAVGTAALTGNIGAFVTELGDLVDRVGHQAHIDTATAGSVTADFHAISEFYNSLSQLHKELHAKMAALKGRALEVHDRPAAGHVAGVQEAWKAIALSAGVMEHANSLYGNLRAIDQWVVHYMGAIMQNATAYAEHEGLVVQSFGRASEADAPVPRRPAGGATTTAGSSHSGW